VEFLLAGIQGLIILLFCLPAEETFETWQDDFGKGLEVSLGGADVF
jgi:hypothetical protein